MKTCNTCSRDKDDSEFNKKTYKSGYVGLRSYCRACDQTARDAWRVTNKERDNERNKAYNRRNAERIRGQKLTKYWPGSTWEQALANHAALVAAQSGRCAICSKPGHPTRGLHVDHCHASGVVRGLLCYNCNAGIGRLQDDTAILANAIAYLRR